MNVLDRLRGTPRCRYCGKRIRQITSKGVTFWKHSERFVGLCETQRRDAGRAQSLGRPVRIEPR